MKISKTKLSIYSSLGTKKMRLRHGIFPVEGEKCVSDMIGAYKLECLVATEKWLKRNSSRIGVEDSQVYEATPAEMNKLSNLSTAPEVIAIMKLPPSDVENPVLPADTLSLLVDGVQDPGNFGTIIRTADWFGFHTVYASSNTVDIFNPKTIQATMGSLRRVRIVYCDLISLIKRSNVSTIIGTLLDGDCIYDSTLPGSGVIIMGNEGNGISDELRELINTPLLIPPHDPRRHAESLNVAVATGIVLSILRNPVKK